MQSAVAFLGLLAAASTATTAAPPVEAPYAQYEADRFRLASSPPPPLNATAPWPVLSLPPLVHISAALPQARHNASATFVESLSTVAVIALAADGSLHGVQPDGATMALAGIAPLPAGSQMGTFRLVKPLSASTRPMQRAHIPSAAAAAALGVITCTPAGCTWYACDGADGACARVAAVSHVLGAVENMVVEETSGDAWINGIATGLARVRRDSPDPAAAVTLFGRQVHGRVTAMALHGSGLPGAGAAGVAVATELAVYYDLDVVSLEFGSHQLVGAVIDDVPTALAFFGLPPAASGVDSGETQDSRPAELWIGHRYCLNVRVCMLTGLQSLPAGPPPPRLSLTPQRGAACSSPPPLPFPPPR